ncbi:pilus assembly protein HofO [Kosakonia quasisacchari]
MLLTLDIWSALSLRTRVLCWVLSSLCALALLWWLAICPVKEAQMRLVTQQQQQCTALRTQWQKLHALVTPSESLTLPELRIFSPLDFQSQGRQLARWQPAQGGGELVLETGWKGVVETFPLLTERGMQVPAFSLMTGEGALNFTLRVEQDNAN